MGYVFGGGGCWLLWTRRKISNTFLEERVVTLQS